jgi:hypothetical protein
LGRLDAMLDLMTVPSPIHEEGRLIGFGEFERLYEQVFTDTDEYRRKTLAAAANSIYRFRPRDRPVFWRVLIAQARLYQALLRTRTTSFEVPTNDASWRSLLRLDDQPEFAWRDRHASGAPLEETLRITDEYLAKYVSGPWLAQLSGHSRPATTSSRGSV